jgi:hypothetical protein
MDFYVLTETPAAVSPAGWPGWDAASCRPMCTMPRSRPGHRHAQVPSMPSCRSTSLPQRWPRAFQPLFLGALCPALPHRGVRDEEVRRKLVAALAQAVRTMIAASLPLARPGDDALKLWQRGLAETYRTELRPNRRSRRRTRGRQRPLLPPSPKPCSAPAGWQRAGHDPAAHGVSWRRRRVAGKSLSVLRLLKAAFTFEGGADYLAWKISRHSGQAIEVRPWQRRHPVLGALWLLPGLLRRGAATTSPKSWRCGRSRLRMGGGNRAAQQAQLVGRARRQRDVDIDARHQQRVPHGDRGGLVGALHRDDGLTSSQPRSRPSALKPSNRRLPNSPISRVRRCGSAASLRIAALRCGDRSPARKRR